LVPQALPSARSVRGRTVTIEFGGIYENSEVWINGQYLGKRPYGYIPFSYDLTPHLVFGRDNVIAVKVDNSHQTNCRWYSGSGIYRRTWLLVTNPVHVAYWGTFVTTPHVSQEAATMQIETRVRNDGTRAAGARWPPAYSTRTAKRAVRGGGPGGCGRGRLRVRTAGDGCQAQPLVGGQSVPVQSRSTVRVEDRVVDQYDTPIGIREAVFDADKGFLLNGEHVKLNGVCIHHDAGCVGLPCPSGCGNGASSCCARWGATPSAPATIPTRRSFWTCATAWDSSS